MSESKNESGSATVQGQNSLLGLFARMFWALWGNIILVFLAYKISQKQTLFSIDDLLYWVIVVLLALSRYGDIKYFEGITAGGLPATMRHWRKYIKYLLLISAGLWVFANGLSS